MRGYPPVLGAPKTYTPAITWPGNTMSGITGQYVKIPGMLLLWVSFSETAGTASALLTIPLPAGYAAVTMAGSLSASAGTLQRNGLAGAAIGLIVAAAGTTVTTTQAITGVVDTWYASAVIPTTT